MAEASFPDTLASPAVAVPSASGVQRSNSGDPWRLYGAEDADVEPPEPFDHAQMAALSAPAPPGTRVIEIIIDHLGNVESARVLTPARSIGEVMEQTANLHAIKAWRFRPALREGTPVRYRELFSAEDLGLVSPLAR